MNPFIAVTKPTITFSDAALSVWSLSFNRPPLPARHRFLNELSTESLLVNLWQQIPEKFPCIEVDECHLTPINFNAILTIDETLLPDKTTAKELLHQVAHWFRLRSFRAIQRLFRQNATPQLTRVIKLTQIIDHQSLLETRQKMKYTPRTITQHSA